MGYFDVFSFLNRLNMPGFVQNLRLKQYHCQYPFSNHPTENKVEASVQDCCGCQHLNMWDFNKIYKNPTRAHASENPG